jgi:hypothetical protein
LLIVLAINVYCHIMPNKEYVMLCFTFEIRNRHKP